MNETEEVTRAKAGEDQPARGDDHHCQRGGGRLDKWAVCVGLWAGPRTAMGDALLGDRTRADLGRGQFDLSLGEQLDNG